MTQIEYSAEKMMLRAKGHAGGGPMGSDIICAGVSVLTQTLLNTLTDEEECGNIELHWLMAPGLINIKVRTIRTQRTKTIIRAYFRLVITGLKDLAEHYPGHIELKEVKEIGDV